MTPLFTNQSVMKCWFVKNITPFSPKGLDKHIPPLLQGEGNKALYTPLGIQEAEVDGLHGGVRYHHREAQGDVPDDHVRYTLGSNVVPDILMDIRLFAG